MQVCPFKEIAILFREQQCSYREIRGQRHIHQQLGYEGVDVILAHPARHRDAMVAVAYEVDIADLPQIDWRQVDQSFHGALDAAPALFDRFGERQKAPVEIAVAALAADDM